MKDPNPLLSVSQILVAFFSSYLLAPHTIYPLAVHCWGPPHLRKGGSLGFLPPSPKSGRHDIVEAGREGLEVLEWTGKTTMVSERCVGARELAVTPALPHRWRYPG